MSASPLPYPLDSTELSHPGVHHGRTLLMLGHAAEHLADSRRFVLGEERGVAPVDEAIHLLMRLSRGVFEEYAEGVAGGRESSAGGCGTGLAVCH